MPFWQDRHSTPNLQSQIQNLQLEVRLTVSSPRCYISDTCQTRPKHTDPLGDEGCLGGEIGRRKGLKILRRFSSIPVRLRSRAPIVQWHSWIAVPPPWRADHTRVKQVCFSCLTCRFNNCPLTTGHCSLFTRSRRHLIRRGGRYGVILGVPDMRQGSRRNPESLP